MTQRSIDRRIDAVSTSNMDSFWLIPTAEVPLTNLVRESILDEAELPLRFTALTPCFRAEAGAAGKDTRGMIRQHQFNKVELVSITTPEQIEGRARAHARLRRGSAATARAALPRDDAVHRRHGLRLAEDLRHRGLAAGAGDVSRDFVLLGVRRFPGAAHECALRAKDGKAPRFVHTLNGSGVAVGRALVAVMETYQQADGSIAVPDVLQPYMGGMKVIETGQSIEGAGSSASLHRP